MPRIIDINNEDDKKFWYERRRIGSATASSIMGVDRWSTPFDVWQLLTYKVERKATNKWMQRGIEQEGKSRSEIEFELGIDYPATNMVHDEYDFLVAAFDGWNQALNEGIEIKTDNKENYALAKSGVIPPEYQPRLDHLLLVSGGHRVGYVSYSPEEGNTLVWYDRDEQRIKELLDKEILFWKCVIEDLPPSLTLRDFVVREDEEWRKYSQQFAHFSAIIDQAEKHKEEAQQKLIELASGQSTFGAGVKVLVYNKKGTINYKKAADELKDILGEPLDMERFRGDTSTITKVSCV